MPHEICTLREAVQADASGIARVHVRSWQVSYRGLVPDLVLDSLSIERRADGWREWLEPDPRRRRELDIRGRIVADAKTWVAVRDDVIVGFVNAGACRDEDVEAGTGEVFAIYTAPEVWGTGVGAKLMRVAANWLRERFASATLWVLEGNSRGRAFYEMGGWTPDGKTKKLDFAGTDLSEMRYRLAFTPSC